MGRRKGSGPTEAQIKAERRRDKELKLLDRQEAQRLKATKRKKRGRASLITGSESGIKEES